MYRDEEKLHVFIDTSTLEDCKYDLPYPALCRILEAEHVILHTTNITISEIHTRIRRQVAKHVQSLEEAEKWREGSGSVGGWRDPDIFIEKYLAHCKYNHDGRGADLGTVVKLFVGRRAPFSDDKPDEFKDAIAAISLHTWAENEGAQIYIVAKDPDWHRMCSDFHRFTYSSLGDLHAHLFKLDDVGINLDLELIVQNLLGDKGKSRLDLVLGTTRPNIENAEPMDVDVQFIDVSALSLQRLDCNIVGAEIHVRVSFSGVAQVQHRDQTVDANIFGLLRVVFGVKYSFHDVEVERWNIILPHEHRQPALFQPKEDQS